MKPSVETIGDRLKRAKDARRFTLSEITKRGGPSKATVFRIETDPSYAPERYTLERLAAALQVNPEWLIAGQGEMEPLAEAARTLNAAFTTHAPTLEVRKATPEEAFVADLLTNLAADEELSDADVGKLTRAVQRTIAKPKK